VNVLFNSSLWSRGGGLPGAKQLVNWRFNYAGAERYIPVVYRFARGIVFDVLTLLEEDRVYAYFEQYEKREEKLSPLERRLAEQEHPYQAVPVHRLWINDQPVMGDWSASTALYVPGWREDAELAVMRRAYRRVLQERCCFACERYAIPYPKTYSKLQELLRWLRLDKVHSLKLMTSPVARFIPLGFELPMQGDEDSKEFKFIHPESGVEHTLHIQRAEGFELPLGERKLFVTQAMYKVTPSLPEGEGLQFDSALQVPNRPDSGNQFLPNSTAAIGMIGGAHGPTSIILGGQGPVQAGWQRCLSLPSLQKEDAVCFRLEGINSLHRPSQEFDFSYARQ